jgi:hypothetical protein
MIFLSKGGQDQYINMFAQGSGTTAVSDFDYSSTQDPIVLRGILKHKLMKRCWSDQRDFYYMDTGYFGNGRWKTWHRIVKNNLQHGDIVSRPSDRWERIKKKFKPWQSGKTIVIAAPDEKPCKFYGIELQDWIDQTVATLQQHTDRPVVVRQRARLRIDRVQNNTLEQALTNAHALVTFNSVAAVEAVFLGVPVFTLAPNAAAPVGCQDLSQIENPYRPDQDKLHAWACHLAYGQFHNDELQNGTAARILFEHD